jgi:hypothetical protein
MASVDHFQNPQVNGAKEMRMKKPSFKSHNKKMYCENKPPKS